VTNILDTAIQTQEQEQSLPTNTKEKNWKVYSKKAGADP